MPCHHTLEAYLHAYLDGTGISADPKGPLLRTIGCGTGGNLRVGHCRRRTRMRGCGAGCRQPALIQRSATIRFARPASNAYLKDGGTLENAAAMANHASTRTTQLYDRRHNDISLDEGQRIRV